MVKIKTCIIISAICFVIGCIGTFTGIYFCPQIGLSAIKRESAKIRFVNSELEKTNQQITDELKSANSRINGLESSIRDSQAILNGSNTTVNDLERINNESRKILDKYQ